MSLSVNFAPSGLNLLYFLKSLIIQKKSGKFCFVYDKKQFIQHVTGLQKEKKTNVAKDKNKKLAVPIASADSKFQLPSTTIDVEAFRLYFFFIFSKKYPKGEKISTIRTGSFCKHKTLKKVSAMRNSF